MKKKFILGATMALVLAGGALTGCSTAYATSLPTDTAPLTASAVAYTSQAGQLATTEANAFVSPTITVSLAPWQYDQIPVGVMPMEEAAQIGARYLWDVFGKCVDGMHIVMSYADCWLRPSAGRWTGIVHLSETAALSEVMFIGDGSAAVVSPINPDAEVATRSFSFTIDSTTGERLEVASRSNTSPAPILHDTQVLWESAQGRAIQAMSDNELAAFIGLTAEQLEVFTQEASAFAEAHFNNSTLQSIELGRRVTTPNGAMRLQGIQPLLDTNADGSIFGTLSGLEFTITSDDGRTATISMSLWMDSISIW